MEPAHTVYPDPLTQVRRSIADISSDLSAAAVGAAGAGDAGRPAYAGGKTLEETYERRRAWSSASPVADVLNGIGYHAPTDRLIVRAR